MIRKALLSDLPAIVEIYNSTIPSRMVTADTEPASVESKKDWFHSHSDTRPLLVSEEDEKITGWMSFKSFYGRPAYKGTIEIGIYLHENFRHKGLGDLFIHEAFRIAPLLSINTILAFIFGHNEPSIRFFKRHGFIHYGTLPQVAVMDGDEYDLVILGYKLN
jgi:L-amino acid N-acyltransferase YncA